MRKNMLSLFALSVMIPSVMFFLIPTTGARQASGKLIKNTSMLNPRRAAHPD